MVRFVLVQLRFCAVDADSLRQILLMSAVLQRVVTIAVSALLYFEHTSGRKVSELVATIASLHEYPVGHPV